MDCCLRIHNAVSTTITSPVFSKNSANFRVFTVKCSSDGAAGVVERPWKVADARLVLEDGSIWKAKSFGARGTQVGEVVFNTSLTGYQEIITDPSYAGQFVLMTNPHIGNTGVNFGAFSVCFMTDCYFCKITVVPSTWPASETLKMKPDGVLFSNGPGDPSAVPYAVKAVKELIGKIPIFGICMGQQLLGQALGGKTFKTKFGHHGGNHPVRNGCVEISAQNHNYAVDPKSLPKGVEVTHVNLNDGSCAGLASSKMKLMSLQYHPEASPGPHDSDPGFDEDDKYNLENIDVT